jgi:hypothetical protein
LRQRDHRAGRRPHEIRMERRLRGGVLAHGSAERGEVTGLGRGPGGDGCVAQAAERAM